MEVDPNGLEVLGRDECLRLLANATPGRIAVTFGALPTVLPVNFWLDGERILIRTGLGGKLDAAAREAVGAFEGDEFDPLSHSGWSVTVTGFATEVKAPDDVARTRQAPVARWAPKGDHGVIAIST